MRTRNPWEEIQFSQVKPTAKSPVPPEVTPKWAKAKGCLETKEVPCQILSYSQMYPSRQTLSKQSVDETLPHPECHIPGYSGHLPRGWKVHDFNRHRLDEAAAKPPRKPLSMENAQAADPVISGKRRNQAAASGTWGTEGGSGMLGSTSKTAQGSSLRAAKNLADSRRGKPYEQPPPKIHPPITATGGIAPSPRDPHAYHTTYNSPPAKPPRKPTVPDGSAFKTASGTWEHRSPKYPTPMTGSMASRSPCQAQTSKRASPALWSMGSLGTDQAASRQPRTVTFEPLN